MLTSDILRSKKQISLGGCTKCLGNLPRSPSTYLSQGCQSLMFRIKWLIFPFFAWFLKQTVLKYVTYLLWQLRTHIYTQRPYFTWQLLFARKNKHVVCRHVPIPFSKIHFNLILPSTPGVLTGLFLSGFPTTTLYAPLLSPIRATCSTRLSHLDFITRMISDEEFTA